jgi:hypothetical protein
MILLYPAACAKSNASDAHSGCKPAAAINACFPCAAAGARMQTTVNNLDKAVLGTCERFEERQVRNSAAVLLL